MIEDGQVKRNPWLIWLGKATRFLAILSALIGLAWLMPAIGDRPLGGITVQEVGTAGVLLVLMWWGLRWLLSDASNDTAEWWGFLGISIIVAAIAYTAF